MAWIKRNIIFVISIAAGLILTGYCSFLLFKSLNDNAGVSQDYQTTLSNLEALQKKSPYPSKENIQAAKTDQERVRKFLSDFKKRFAPFPAPRKTDEKGFKSYLDDTILRFRAEATSAGVELPVDFGFAFSGLMGRLTYPPGNIGPWMQQLEEIDTILNILYAAKINYLGALGRVPVSADDTGAGLQASVVTNQSGVVTPYRITFRGFSAEIAAVMEGFARSSNCFIIKAIVVNPDTSVQPLTALTPGESPGSVYPGRLANPFVPQTANVRPNARPERIRPDFQRGPGGPGGRPGPPPRKAAQAPATAPSVAVLPVAAGSTTPVTILSENPLSVTISIDVVKLKASEH